MATSKTQSNEREYVIPLRHAWAKAARYKRTRRSIVAIKEFIAKHMRVPDRDLRKVKLDVYLNNEIWFRGCKKPPVKVKVKAVRKEDLVEVTLIEVPDRWKFLKTQQDKKHKKVEKKKVPIEEKKEDKEQTKEEKTKEEDKAKSVEQTNIKIAERAAKTQKHTVRGDGPQIQRKALKK